MMGVTMQIVYDKLFNRLKANGIIMKKFRDDTKLGGSIITRLQHNQSVNTETIGKICEYLQCQPNDIMEVIYDEDVIRANAERMKVERQIAELQAKLKKM
jgi:DNA-binding Xre family transcriptional regulator